MARSLPDLALGATLALAPVGHAGLEKAETLVRDDEDAVHVEGVIPDVGG